MDLVKYKSLNKAIPIRSIPNDELNRIILIDLTEWVANLLSLTDEVSANRLEIALPAIKEHCWSMGFAEITKMFEMYADNKLSVKPLSNYFDRILFGQIVQAYKDQKPRAKQVTEKKPLSEEEKQLIVFTGILNCFENYKEDKIIPPGYSYVYDFFFEKGRLPKHSAHFRTRIHKIATEKIKDSLLNQPLTTQVKDKIDKFKQGIGIKTKCKEIILSEYFDKLIKKDIDIKTEMK